MIYFFRFFFGYVDFAFVGGFCEEFLTECFERGIEIHNACKTEYGFTAGCRAGTYKKLHHIARAHGGIVRITKKHGLPFIAKPLRNRMGLAVGALAFVLIVALLNSFVWKVEIVGSETISDTTICSFLEQNNLKAGTMWSSVNREKLRWELMSEFENISWVHINKDGAVAIVEINEKRPKPEPADEELLQGKNIFRRQLQVVAMREQRDMSVKSTNRFRKIHFFGIKIPLYLKYRKGDISSCKVSYLRVKDVELPIGIEELEETKLQYKTKMLNDKELKSLAKRELKVNEEQELDGFEIINRSDKFNIDSDKCELTAVYIIRRK